MKDARKLFRLFKSINEIQKIIELVKKQDNDELNKALNILCRFFFGLYWYFDNLVILKTVKFIQGDHKADGKNGSTCWLLGLICNHIQNVRGLISNFQEEQNVSQKILASTSEEDTQKLAGQMKKLKKARTDLYLSVLKTSGDTITAGQGKKSKYKMNCQFLIDYVWIILQLQTCGPLFSERVLMMVSLVLVVSLQPLSLLTSFSENRDAFIMRFQDNIVVLRNIFCICKMHFQNIFLSLFQLILLKAISLIFHLIEYIECSF